MTVAHQLLNVIHVDAKFRVPLNQLPLGTGKIFVGDISHGLATDRLGQTRLLVLVVGGPCLVNAILVTGIWAGSKVMSMFATIPAGQLTGESMDGFHLV